ncbi:Uncharacterized protein APZ42_014249 [Daphnia magna]|uniref:Uncharacterized protein n=1 Tax=Daphnia magna TaxID=35525 RepID=A0A162Q2Q4_9CRUS|nr:Uncharacterized protein APZ42_014249 [Daphnia magna]
MIAFKVLIAVACIAFVMADEEQKEVVEQQAADSDSGKDLQTAEGTLGAYGGYGGLGYGGLGYGHGLYGAGYGGVGYGHGIGYGAGYGGYGLGLGYGGHGLGYGAARTDGDMALVTDTTTDTITAIPVIPASTK